jgi:hypothetical protein
MYIFFNGYMYLTLDLKFLWWMLQEEFEDTKAVINFSSGPVAHGQ